MSKAHRLNLWLAAQLASNQKSIKQAAHELASKNYMATSTFTKLAAAYDECLQLQVRAYYLSTAICFLEHENVKALADQDQYATILQYVQNELYCVSLGQNSAAYINNLEQLKARVLIDLIKRIEHIV